MADFAGLEAGGPAQVSAEPRDSGAPAQEALDFARRRRAGDQEALQLMAAVHLQEGALGLALHAFGDRLQPQAVGHADDGCGDLALGAVAADVADAGS